MEVTLSLAAAGACWCVAAHPTWGIAAVQAAKLAELPVPELPLEVGTIAAPEVQQALGWVK